MPNKKKLPKLSKRTENLEAWLNEVTEKHNFVAYEVERLDRDNTITRTRLDQLEKNAEKVNTQIDDLNKIVASINKKIGLLVNVSAKGAGRTKTLQQDATKPSAGNNNTIAALTSSMNIIASSLGIMNSQLSKLTGTKIPVGAQQVEAPGPSAAAPLSEKGAPKEEGMIGMLKSLFTNPAVVASLAGIVYTILPKAMQEQVKSFLGGFASGLEDAMGENEQQGLGSFNTALKGAGIALTTYFGAKMIGGIASAITTTLNVVKMLGGGKLGRGALVLGAGAAVGAGAMALSGGKKGESEGEEGSFGGGVNGGGGTGGGGAALPSMGAEPEAKATPSGTAPEDKDGKVALIRTAANDVGLTNPYAQTALLANIEKESGFKARSENLNYSSTARIKQVFPSAVKKAGLEEGDLQQYVNNPEGLAELVYGYKSPLGPGMGNTEPGDGYKYRGRGYIQLTGKKNYAYYGKMLGIDLIKNPDLANNPLIAAKIAAAFVKTGLKGKQDFSSQGEANIAVTQVIGGSALNLNAGIGAELLAKVNAAASQFGGEGAGTMVASAPATGATINQTSQDVRNAARPGSQTTLANVDSSTKGGGKQEPGIQAPIPSPIASRGTLGIGTKHSTAYA